MTIPIYVRCLKIPADIDSAEKSRLLSLLSPAEKRHYHGIKRQGRRREYLLGHVLMRLVMACDGCKGRHFNLSHSGVWVVCASADHPVGVDVEYVRHRPRAADIAAKWFSPQENRFLLSCAPTLRSLAFTRLWVLKEALFKTGLLALKDLVGNSFFQITKAGRVKSLQPSWRFSLHALSRGYVLGVACESAHPVLPVIERVKWESLCAS